MTTPRIEELVEHCTKMKPKFIETKNWVEYTVRYAHQAGIDEAVEAITKHLEVKSDTEIWISPQKLRDTIKALQDNK